MSRRIDVELTSARDDGTWTWRAAGAREPRGILPAELVYAGAKVGDIVKADADFDIDGITIVSVVPPKSKAQPSNLIEVTGAGRDFQPVTSSLLPKREGGRRDHLRRGDGDRGGQDRPARPQGERPRGDRGPRRGEGPQRPPHEGDVGSGSGVPQRERRTRSARSERPDPGGRSDRAPRAGNRADPPAKARPKRLSPGNKHRAAVVESLSPEQRPVAEQVLRGGIPALRRAIEEQNNQARAEGLPEVKADALVALAEELLPRLKAAEWRDRAEAAVADVDGIGLRDLRSVVNSADGTARDEESRRLAMTLREALERRVKEQQEAWTGEISSTLGDGRLVRALRLAARPPDPATRLPAEMALRLSSAASEAMATDIPPERWLALLEAVAASPVRLTVKPAGLPAEADQPLLEAAHQHAGRVPALAALLGISIPPPPGPLRRPRRPERPIPPPPTAPPAPGPAVSDAQEPAGDIAEAGASPDQG